MDNFRAIFYEIVQGFSRAADFYIKHLHAAEQSNLDSYYDDFFADGKKRGLPTTESRLALLEKQKLWAKEDEDKIEQIDCLKIDVEDAEKEIFEAKDFPKVAKKIKYIIGEHLGLASLILKTYGFDFDGQIAKRK